MLAAALLSSLAVEPASPELIEPQQPQGPAVAAVLVAHNQREALTRCLKSLDASSVRPRMEIIVVDSGSSDGSGRVDEEFEGVTVLRLPRDFGRTRARNIGLRTAKAELLLFTDPAVEFEPRAVEAMMAALDADPQAAAAVPAFRSPAGETLPCGRAFPSASTLKRASLDGAPLPESPSLEAIADWAFLIRRPVLKGMNGFDDKRFSEHWAELEMCWQIRNAGKRIVAAPGAAAILHPAPPVRDQTLLAADRVSGAASYLAKRNGLLAGLLFRLSCAFTALSSGRLSLFTAILSASRVDPT